MCVCVSKTLYEVFKELLSFSQICRFVKSNIGYIYLCLSQEHNIIYLVLSGKMYVNTNVIDCYMGTEFF